MELLHPTSFAASVASSWNQLEKISEITSKYCGPEKANRFLSACQSLDFSEANSILDDTVKAISGCGSVDYALNAFAEKFPQIKDLGNRVFSAAFESEKVKEIEKSRDQILGYIERSR